MQYSEQKYKGYRATLTCGHGRRLQYGSAEDLDLIQYGWAYCNTCNIEQAVVGWKPRGAQVAATPPPQRTPQNGDRVETAGAHSSWISPEGAVFYVGSAQHYSTAQKMGSTLDRLENAGWVHFSFTGVHMVDKRKMTESQRSALFDHWMAFSAIEQSGKTIPDLQGYLRGLRPMFEVKESASEPAYNPDDLWA